MRRLAEPGAAEAKVWRLVSLAFAVLIVLGVATSPAWAPTREPEPLVPPFTAPPIASVLPSTEQVNAWYGRELTPLLNRPPTKSLFTSNTAAAQDIRRVVFQEAWEVAWKDAHGLGYVEIVATVHRRHGISVQVLDCKPTSELEIEGTQVAGVVTAGDGATIACAIIGVGRTFVSVRTATRGPDHSEHAHEVLTAIVAYVVPQLSDSPDAPGPYRYELTGSLAMRAHLVGLLVLGVLAAGPSIVDRSRLRQWLNRQRWRIQYAFEGVPAWPSDVEPERYWQAARATALGLGRFALILWTLRLTHEVQGLAQTLVQAGCLAGAYVAGILLQRLIVTGRRGGPRPAAAVRGAAIIPVLAGAAGTALLLMAAATVLASGSSMVIWGTGNVAVADWQVSRMGILSQLAAVALFSCSLAPLAFGRRIAMRMQRNKPVGSGAPTLLLRTFADDQVKIPAHRHAQAGLLDHLAMKRKEYFEEIVAFSLSRFGPPIAVGEPGQLLPPGLGAQRMLFSNETWQAGVRGLANEARLVVLTLGRTAGLGWEMQLLESEGLLHKTIFLLPPVGRGERQERLELFARAYRLPAEFFDVEEAGREVLAIAFPLNHPHPLLVVSASTDGLSYDLAIERCVTALLDEPVTEFEAQGVASFPELGTPDAAGAAVMQSGPSEACQIHIPRPQFDPTVMAAVIPQPARRRSWWARPWVLIPIANAMVASVVLPLLTGDPIGSDSASAVLNLGTGYTASVALGGHGDMGWLLVDNQTVVRGNFANTELTGLAVLERMTEVATLSDGTLYYLGFSHGEGAQSSVARLDLPEQVLEGSAPPKEAWITPVAESAQAIGIDAEHVYVPQPEARSVLILDRATGRLTHEVDLPCQPWGLAVETAIVWVSCPNTGQAVSIDTGSRTITGTYPVPVGAMDIVVWQGHPWVNVPVGSTIVSVENPDTGIWMSQFLPQVAARGDQLVVQGADRVSIFTPEDTTRRNTHRKIGSLAITDDGGVQYTSGQIWRLLKP